ncbi:Nucleus export protein brr6 [Smittium mucronatum]|nr:Nucleus export protein brr6 [Smittium mucronatum]
MESECRLWESCMNRDPIVVGRGKISAETFAEIINGFIEPITLKTMSFFLLLFFGSLYINNTVFSNYRKKKYSEPQNVPFPNESTGLFLMTRGQNPPVTPNNRGLDRDFFGSFTAPQHSRNFSEIGYLPLPNKDTPTTIRDRNRFKK